eukprot:TRINITY_DN58378_c0_g1_i2.p1 TRINITY_DN58378_c0_g1~~TRINITY_DN58378_c0_g1_i2.p1  ORF type:complete len:565 (-),score=59.63 TRINITY_DN58378_c0_g1_i2:11-1705(-)
MWKALTRASYLCGVYQGTHAVGGEYSAIDEFFRGAGAAAPARDKALVVEVLGILGYSADDLQGVSEDIEALGWAGFLSGLPSRLSLRQRAAIARFVRALAPEAKESRVPMRAFSGSTIPANETYSCAGLPGSPERDDARDLKDLCDRFRVTKIADGAPCFDVRNAGQDWVFLPSADRTSSCNCLQRSGQNPDETECSESIPFLNVLVLLEPHHQGDALESRRWLAQFVLPAFGRPVRIILQVCRDGMVLMDVPVLDNSLVVADSYSGGMKEDPAWVFDFGKYAVRARAMGVTNMGLFHMGHEVFWETAGVEEDLTTSVSRRADGNFVEVKHYLQDYEFYDYVLRNYHSRAYASSSTYVPLGMGVDYPYDLADAFSMPMASKRTIFCSAAFGHDLDPWNTWYKGNRGLLIQTLAKIPGVCVNPGQSDRTYKDALQDSMFSLCPFGSTEETHRLWESLLAGAIVVTTRAAFIDYALPGAPFIVLDNWEELPETLSLIKAAPAVIDQIQAVQTTWFNNFLLEVQARLRATSRAHFDRIAKPWPVHGDVARGCVDKLLVVHVLSRAWE